MQVAQINFPGKRQLELMVLTSPNQSDYSCTCWPHVPKSLFDLLPGLKRHVCHNYPGLPFVKEAMITEIPHLFEHVVLELQRRAHDLSGQRIPLLTGLTEWNWKKDPVGTFRIRIGCHCQPLALAAVSLGERLINALINGDTRNIHVIDELNYLQALAKLAGNSTLE